MIILITAVIILFAFIGVGVAYHQYKKSINQSGINYWFKIAVYCFQFASTSLAILIGIGIAYMLKK